MTNEAKWRITIPIEKAEERDGGMYIVGLASGPETDLHGQEMDPQAIVGCARQIENAMEMGTPIPYRDWHRKDGLLIDLGYVTKGWVDEKFHLGVEVKLDEDNPAAVYLFKSIQKGKQYGMSVAGTVPPGGFKDIAKSTGERVRRFFNVVLEEISNTTKPVWTPSLGTVLTKAIDAASVEPSDGDNLMPEELHADEQSATTEDAAETAKAEESVEETPQANLEPAAETTEKAEETESAEQVEKAGRRISAATRDRLLAMRAEIDAALKEIGAIEEENSAPDADSQDSGDNLNKAVDETHNDETTQLRAEVEELAKSVRELTDQVAELAKRPLTTLPPSVGEKDGTDLLKSLASLSPSERLRIGLAAMHSGDSRR